MFHDHESSDNDVISRDSQGRIKRPSNKKKKLKPTAVNDDHHEHDHNKNKPCKKDSF